MTKQLVNVELTSIKYELDGKTIPAAIVRLKELRKEYGDEAKIDIGQECEAYSYSDEKYAYVRLMGDRLETDEEYKKRTDQEKYYADQRAAADLAAYERVKKSMEGKS